VGSSKSVVDRQVARGRSAGRPSPRTPSRRSSGARRRCASMTLPASSRCDRGAAPRLAEQTRCALPRRRPRRSRLGPRRHGHGRLFEYLSSRSPTRKLVGRRTAESWNAAQMARDLRHALGELLRAERAARDEARHQAILDPRGHRRARSPGAAAASVARALGLTVDAEQVRVLAGPSDDVLALAERHTEVAVGDAAGERLRPAVRGPSEGSSCARMSFNSPTAST